MWREKGLRWIAFLIAIVAVSGFCGRSVLEPGSMEDPSNAPEAISAIIGGEVLRALQEDDGSLQITVEQVLPEVSSGAKETIEAEAAAIIGVPGQDTSASEMIRKDAAGGLELFLEDAGVDANAAVAEDIIDATLERLELAPSDLADGGVLELQLGSAASLALQCNRAIVSLDPERLLQSVAGLMPEPPCPNVADANENGGIDSSDAFLMIFREETLPAALDLEALEAVTVDALGVAIRTGISSTEQELAEALSSEEDLIEDINTEETGRLSGEMRLFGKELPIQQSALASMLAVLGAFSIAELFRIGGGRFGPS